eukprot:ctg_2411.g565
MSSPEQQFVHRFVHRKVGRTERDVHHQGGRVAAIKRPPTALHSIHPQN